MGFGLRDKDWIEPPEVHIYRGRCNECIHFEPCACGCGWGRCAIDPTEQWDGESFGCEEGEYRYEPTEESDYGSDSYRRAS